MNNGAAMRCGGTSAAAVLRGDANRAQRLFDRVGRSRRRETGFWGPKKVDGSAEEIAATWGTPARR